MASLSRRPMKLALPFLLGAMLFSQSASADGNIIDRNVGYPFNGGPVSPSRLDCLTNQEVFGATTTIWMGAACEPSIAVNPKNERHVVAVWQQDRINNGGALEVGIATSSDGGNSWVNSTVPLQICNGGITQRISDVWLSYSKDGKTLYLTGLYFNATFDDRVSSQQGVFVVTSEDNGKSWKQPISLLTQTLGDLNDPQYPSEDKCSITADINDSEKAYAVFDHFFTFFNYGTLTQFSRTHDRGKTWSTPVTIYSPMQDLQRAGLSNGITNDAVTIDNVIISMPKGSKAGGDLLNFMARSYATPNATDDQYSSDEFPFQYSNIDVAVIRSKDGGETWDQTATIIAKPSSNVVTFTGGYTYDDAGNINGSVGVPMRSGSNSFFVGNSVMAAYAVNPKNGNLYVVWTDGVFRGDQLPNIALSTSRDGGYTWTQPVQVNRTPSDCPNPQAFCASVAVTEEGHVGVIYSDFRFDNMECPERYSLTDTWLAVYREVDDPRGGSLRCGLDFDKEVRLSQESYIAQNGPVTSSGTMTNGDYSFIVGGKNKFYAAYTQSFNGPFAPPVLIVDDPENDAQVYLDNNHRQDPFISIVRQ